MLWHQPSGASQSECYSERSLGQLGGENLEDFLNLNCIDIWGEVTIKENVNLEMISQLIFHKAHIRTHDIAEKVAPSSLSCSIEVFLNYV